MLFNHAFDQFMAQGGVTDRRVVTLGPSGTSSYMAAVHFTKAYPAEIALFPTYEAGAEAVRDMPRRSLLIVANAYAAINQFYISSVLQPIGAFFKDTPPYVVAARSAAALESPEVRLSSHPAPRHLLAHLAARPNVTICDAPSTHAAAEQVVQGHADACLTTQVAADMLGLQTLDVAFPTIPMLWTVFACREV